MSWSLDFLLTDLCGIPTPWESAVQLMGLLVQLWPKNLLTMRSRSVICQKYSMKAFLWFCSCLCWGTGRHDLRQHFHLYSDSSNPCRWTWLPRTTRRFWPATTHGKTFRRDSTPWNPWYFRSSTVLLIGINNTGQLQTGYSASFTRRPNSCNRTEVLLRSHNREDGDVDSQGQSELTEESQQFNSAPQVLPNVSLSALISP